MWPPDDCRSRRAPRALRSRTVAGGANSTAGSRLPCRATRAADPLARAAQVDRPVEPDRIGAAGGDLFEPQAAALGEDDDGYARAVVLALRGAGRRACGVVQARSAGRRRRPARRPRCRRSSRPARRRRSARSGRPPPPAALMSRMRCIRSGRAYSIVLTVRKSSEPRAFDHVAGQRPRAAGEADQRHAGLAIVSARRIERTASNT